MPRPEFDQILRDRFVEKGVELVAARVSLSSEGEHLRLAPENLALSKTFRGAQPDLVVDASGRRRLSARHLTIGARLGPRKDVSHFTHFHGFDREQPAGQPS
jgi:hypothetical protein